MERTVICQQCGKEFTATHPSKKYCSAECLHKSRLKNSENYRLRNKQAVKRRPAKSKTDWAAIVRECKAAGLSYGEATARGII